MPNTREKLIELLGDVQYLGGLEEKVADHLIANGVTIQKWIPVTERLPELETYTYSVDVLFRDYKEGIHVGYVCLETGTWREKYSRDQYAAHKVTHWMPLPEPPMDLPKITDQTMDAIKKIGEQSHGGE